MTDSEIDTLVAEKVMDWVLHLRNTIHWTVKGQENEVDYDIMDLVGEFRPTKCMQDAWMVVEKIKSLTKYNGELHSTRDPWIRFCFALSGDDYDDGFNLHAFWHVNPKSICFAALKAVGVEI